MAKFTLPDGSDFAVDDDSNLQKLELPIGVQVTLQLTGISSPSRKSIHCSGNVASIEIAVVSATDTIMTFTLKAKSAGTVKLSTVLDDGRPSHNPLTVVIGKFENHDGMEIDLIAKVCNEGDPVKIRDVVQMLHNSATNIFEQGSEANKDPKYGNMACGIVAKKRGTELFGSMSPIDYEHPYHQPLSRKATSRSDVKYKPETLRKACQKIQGILAKGTPVRVGVLDNPVNMTVISGSLYAYWPGGHTVLIVGCDHGATSFMYIDPWGGGSLLEYTGGIPGDNRPKTCEYMGIFTLTTDPDRKIGSLDTKNNLLRQDVDTEGSFSTAGKNFLEIVSGP
ncbi:hypothetical protein ACYOEI_06575 [Singulisphaera rosea]